MAVGLSSQLPTAQSPRYSFILFYYCRPTFIQITMSLILITFAVVYVFSIVFILSGLFRHNNLSISSSSDLPSVTVVVAARNEEEVILNLIQEFCFPKTYSTPYLTCLWVLEL